MSDGASRLDRTSMLERIEHNIQRSGYHLYVVSGDELPRYAYTIGLRESLGRELILGGAIYYMMEEVLRIVSTIREQMRSGDSPGRILPVDALGSFTLRETHASWVDRLMLGAIDYYGTRDIDAFQIVPDEAHWTIDVPDMRTAPSAQAVPAWRCL